jgi:histidinol-phosphate/aromatic aminotransferase/cobyric acid decarboxylase-like protein
MSPVAPEPGPHGAEGARLARSLGVSPDEVLDLSQSLNPVAPDVAPMVAEVAGEVHRYPDPAEATEALAEAMGVSVERVVLTNGGAEAIALVARLQPVGWVDNPDFSLYARHLERLDPDGPLWRSNPNNPTGALAPDDATAAVWDEAFYPLATGAWTRGDADSGAIVVGSLTKLFACPGLRLGYVLAPEAATAEAVRTIQPRWSVNALALAVLPSMLGKTDLPGWRDEVAELRTGLVALLEGQGLVPRPSAANYVLVEQAPGLREGLARRAVAVRDAGSFGFPNGVRVAVPDAHGLDRLADALRGAEG